jgi:tetratricopeptide (TPR) repeat protein
MEETMGSETKPMKQRIANWLAVTQAVEVRVGLDADEAARRAPELLRAILDRRLSPESVVLDDDLKQVLSVLVSRLATSISDPEERLHEADAVYQFILRLAWPTDHFGEQQDLLIECAEIGWSSIGLTLADVEHRRREGASAIRDRKAEPITAIDEFLATAAEHRDSELTERVYGKPDDLGVLCRNLRGRWEASPINVATEASALYGWLAAPGRRIGLFDELVHFRGEAALIGGVACRFLGRLEDAERWFDRAEFGFRLTVNAGPAMARVAYARLALRYVKGLHADVLESAPSLAANFESLRMCLEAAKCAFLEAKSLQQLGRVEESVLILQRLRQSEQVRGDRGLYGNVLILVGNYCGSVGDFEAAAKVYGEALTVVDQPGLVASLKWSVGDTYRSQGQLEGAVNAYRSAQRDYAALEMSTYVALVGLVTAETLLALNHPREAEWEILAALPTIEEQKMVPEGFAAVALLKESVRRRQTDPNALRELREHLRANQN